ncbi:MAG: response regulator [Ottowia sp.]|nr:response regulator [Ottowia sp.]
MAALQSARLRTYLVEDNATIRENLLATLDELVGITPVGFAEREQPGSKWLLENADAWDLAIVDLFLIQGSGFGVLMACQQRPPEQKIVVLSNYATPEVRQRCQALGADAVFDKSTDIDELIDFCLELASDAA